MIIGNKAEKNYSDSSGYGRDNNCIKISNRIDEKSR